MVVELETLASHPYNIIPLKKPVRLSACTLQDLPHIELDVVVECLRDDEFGDARLFALLFHELCVYDFLECVWYTYEGHYWLRDDAQGVYHLVSGFLSSAYIQASAEINLQIKGERENGEETKQEELKDLKRALLKRSTLLKKIARVRNVLEFAKSDKTLQVPHQRSGKEVTIAWDKNPWLLGTLNGVLDLRTGMLAENRPSDFIRTIAPTQWEGTGATCPRFEQFLQEIFSDRPEQDRKDLIHFLHKVFGYGITGLTTHHVFLALIGEQGRNGKDTLMKRFISVLGKSLAGPVPKELFISTKFGASPGAASPHIMSLQGKRLAWCDETDKGDSFNIGQIKEYTGGGSLSGRALRENQQTFDPTHLLLLLTNNPPHADATDKAFWTRICPIMFNVRFVDAPDSTNPLEHKPDTKLGETLDKESSGILAWFVRGCLLWQQEGLTPPQEILKARGEYKTNEDTIGRFIKECCVLRPDCKETGRAIYTSYVSWAEDNNLKPLNGITFGRDMEKRFRKTIPGHVATYHGIGLRSNEQYAAYVEEDDAEEPEPELKREAFPLTEEEQAGTLNEQQARAMYEQVRSLLENYPAKTVFLLNGRRLSRVEYGKKIASQLKAGKSELAFDFLRTHQEVPS